MKRLMLPPMIGHVLAWAAFFGVVLFPSGYSGMTTSSDGLRDTFFFTAGPFRRYLGFEEILLLLIPVALTGLAVWLAWRHGAVWSAWTRPVLWGLGMLCLAYCSVTIWFIRDVDISFIGVFFVPSAAALIISAIVVSMGKPTPDATSGRWFSR